MRRINHRRLPTILALLVWASVAPAEARRHSGNTTMTDTDKLFWEAAQALYGEGLKITRSKRSTTIEPRPGGMTQERYNRYVKEVYLEILRADLAKLHGGHWRWAAAGYAPPGAARGPRGTQRAQVNPFDTRGPEKRAHLLLEPYLKYKLCNHIVARIGHKPNIVEAYKRIGWCAVQAMNEAISPLYVYRGQKVTWNAPLDKGDLEVGDVIWKPDASGNYPQVVTVAGGSRIYTLASTNILFKLTEGLQADLAPAAHAKGTAMYKETLKIYHKLLKQIARKQLKLAGGKKVIFAEQRFYDTVAVAPAKGPIDCTKLFYLVYAPAQSRSEGYIESVEVNGTPCQEFPMSSGEVDRNDILGLSCGRYLKPGNNTVSVGVYNSITAFNHSRREWRRIDMRYQLKNVTYTATERGKKLYAESITCIKK